MKQRCHNRKHANYPNYGGRGISVCPRWRGKRGFKNFLADMGEKPEGMTLERIKRSGHYEPGNCKWATWKEQMHNRRRLGSLPRVVLRLK